MEYQTTLQVVQLDEPVFDNLVLGNPIWPQWEVYSPYDLLAQDKPATVLEDHLKAPGDKVDEPMIPTHKSEISFEAEPVDEKDAAEPPQTDIMQSP